MAVIETKYNRWPRKEPPMAENQTVDKKGEQEFSLDASEGELLQEFGVLLAAEYLYAL